MKRLPALPVALLLIGSLAAPAVATGRTYHDTWTGDATTTDTAICGFEITITSHVDGEFVMVFDSDGNWIRSVEHDWAIDSFAAHGKTLVALPYHFNGITALDADGNMTMAFAAGEIEKVMLPDGSVFRSTGRYDFLAHAWAPTIVPDSGHAGNVEAFCEALS